MSITLLHSPGVETESPAKSKRLSQVKTYYKTCAIWRADRYLLHSPIHTLLDEMKSQRTLFMSKGSEESYRQTVKKASLLRAASVKKQNKKKHKTNNNNNNNNNKSIRQGWTTLPIPLGSPQTSPCPPTPRTAIT